jgi:lysozyme
MKIGEKGVQLIIAAESLHDGDLKMIGLQPKMCPAGYWTEGYGNVILDSHGNMLKGEANKALAYKLSTVKNEAEALKQLYENVNNKYGVFVDSLGLNLNQNQFDALTSFTYNCGKNALRTSTLLKRIKAKASDKDITAAFAMFNKSDGKVMPGLVKRRREEAKLFLSKEL